MKIDRDKIRQLFESRRSHLDYRLKRDFVKNGIATIPCQISDYNDVINSYSVKGCESLNMEFHDYVTSCADVVPDDCPLVLNIVGDCLSSEQQETIKMVTLDAFAYKLGIVERDERRHTKTFFLMFIGLLLSGILLWFTRSMDEEPREMVFILFWFMGDTLCDYLFRTGHDLRRERRLAGRLASIKIVFTDQYEAAKYTRHEIEQIYAEIERDVNDTLQ